MSSTRKPWMWFLLAPVIVLITMELLLQAGSLLVQSGARDMPRNWLTDNTRVLALGDSATFGLYLEPDQSYPAQLQERWNETYPEHSIEVLNLGYPGMNSFRILDNVDAMMETFRPDVVLLTVGVNDLLTPVEQIAYEGDSLWARIVRTVGRHSRLLHMIHMFRQSRSEPAEVEIERRDLEWDDDVNKRMTQLNEFKQANAADGADERMTADGQEFIVARTGTPAKNLRYLEGNLGKIREIVSGYDAEFYLLTYGASASFYARSNRHARRFAQQSEVRFIDVAREMKRLCPASNDCPSLFFEDLHPNAAGYEVIADVVAKRLSADWELRN